MSNVDAQHSPQTPKKGPIYRDIREYLAELERRELLIRVKRPINKDTELMPLVAEPPEPESKSGESGGRP